MLAVSSAGALSVPTGYLEPFADPNFLAPADPNATLIDLSVHGGSLSRGCPANKRPWGVLFNHVSKTGGTSFKQLLEQATGGLRKTAIRVHGLNIDYFNSNRHYTSNPSHSPNGALVIQDDVHHGLKLTRGDAQNFFTIGLVRRPCDYLLSSWVWDLSLIHI